MSFVVAIDGPAGSGKGTVTQKLGERFDFVTFDTGAMYRAVTYYMIQNNIDVNDKKRIEEMLKNIDIKLEFENRVQILFLNSKKLVLELRTKEVNELVSIVSHIPEVRAFLVNLQRKLASDMNVILEGRDIGTNVFPNADVKIYLDATAEERANRRYKQNLESGVNNISYEEILENIKLRDYNDLTSDVAPLKKADDAILVDTTNMTIEEVVSYIEEIIKNKMK